MLHWAEKFRSTFAQRLKEIVLPEPVNVEAEALAAEAVSAAPEPVTPLT
jgi:hypothetical protein